MIICTKNDSKNVFPCIEERYSELLQTVNLEGENLVCIAGRPGMGKTALSFYMALEYALKHLKTVYIFSMDLSAEWVYDRLLIQLSEIDSYTFRNYKLNQKDLSEEESEKLARAREKVSQVDLIIDDQIVLTIQEIEAKLRKTSNLGVVVVDYMQLIIGDGKSNTRVQECKEIVRQLKLLSMEFNIPIILISQLPRGVEYRKDKRPRLSDLEGAGVLECDVDIVCLIYREGYYEPYENPEAAEVIIPKNKCGDCGVLKLKWQGCCAKFSEDI